MTEQEVFHTKKPKHPFLSDYISYYYFHTIDEEAVRKKFIYYPGYKNALTIYRHSTVEYGRHYSSVKPDASTDFIFLYSGVQKHFRTAYITSPFNKIGVVFNELGINHFIDEPLTEISGHPIDKSFNYFGESLKDCCCSVYAEADLNKKVDLLDRFFMDNYCGLQPEILKTSVAMIMKDSQKRYVKELSESMDVSRRTLLRLFKKHLGCSVKDYIDIVQFRKSLHDYLLEKEADSLTEVAYNNDYYDQSQFIRHFKKLAGVPPKEFFENVDHIGREDTFWTFK